MPHLAVRAAVSGILPELHGGVTDMSLVHLRTNIVIAQILVYSSIAMLATLGSQRYMEPDQVSGFGFLCCLERVPAMDLRESVSAMDCTRATLLNIQTSLTEQTLAFYLA